MLTPADHEDLTRRLDFLLDETADFNLYQSLTWEDYKEKRKRRHEYIDIRWDAIKKFIKESQPLLTEFSNGVKNFLLNE